MEKEDNHGTMTDGLLAASFLTHLPTSHPPCPLPKDVTAVEPGTQICSCRHLVGYGGTGIGLCSQLPCLQKQEPGRKILVGTNEDLQLRELMLFLKSPTQE